MNARRNELVDQLVNGTYTSKSLDELRKLTRKLNKKNKDKPLPASIQLCPADRVPKVGEWIYVGTAMSFDHGYYDVVGGLAQVYKVGKMKSGGKVVSTVYVKEHGHRGGKNWDQFTSKEQDKLAEMYGYSFAYPDPDYNDYRDSGEWQVVSSTGGWKSPKK